MLDQLNIKITRDRVEITGLDPNHARQNDDPALHTPAGRRFTASDGVVSDATTGLQWSQDDVPGKRLTFAKAEAACRDLTLGGHDDWRLPTRAELLSLVDDTRHSPAIDTDAFPKCESAYYWTSTLYAASPSDYAWIVGFYSGSSDLSGRDNYYRVRAVRGASRQ